MFDESLLHRTHYMLWVTRPNTTKKLDGLSSYLPRNVKRGVTKNVRGVSEQERGIQILRRAGALAELTPEEKQLAAAWDALPETRKQQVIEKLKTTKFNPPLSETVIQDRE